MQISTKTSLRYGAERASARIYSLACYQMFLFLWNERGYQWAQCSSFNWPWMVQECERSQLPLGKDGTFQKFRDKCEWELRGPSMCLGYFNIKEIHLYLHPSFSIGLYAFVSWWQHALEYGYWNSLEVQSSITTRLGYTSWHDNTKSLGHAQSQPQNPILAICSAQPQPQVN